MKEDQQAYSFFVKCTHEWIFLNKFIDFTTMCIAQSSGQPRCCMQGSSRRGGSRRRWRRWCCCCSRSTSDESMFHVRLFLRAKQHSATARDGRLMRRNRRRPHVIQACGGNGNVALARRHLSKSWPSTMDSSTTPSQFVTVGSLAGAGSGRWQRYRRSAGWWI